MTVRSRRQFFNRLATGVAMVIGSRFATAADPPAAPAAPEEYVCPPCGCKMDDKVFSKPGNCPACDMPLRKKTARKVAGHDDHTGDHHHPHADHTSHV